MSGGGVGGELAELAMQYKVVITMHRHTVRYKLNRLSKSRNKRTSYMVCTAYNSVNKGTEEGREGKKDAMIEGAKNGSVFGCG